MRNHLIKQLREYSSVKGKQRTWVSKLTDDQLYGLFLRLRNEESAKSIAQYIQQAWGVNPKSTIHSISQGILKFKKRIAHLLLSPSSTEIVNSVHFDSDHIVSLESLEGMERVAQLQRERIERMMKEERDLGVKHSNLSRDLQSQATLSKVIMRQKEFEIRHENNDPVKRRRLKRLEHDFDKEFNRVIKDIAPTKNDREKIIKSAYRFIELIDERSIRIDEITTTNE